jgi:hypothetical protein
LVPEPFLRPEGCVAAFGQVVEGLDPAARVLDCAAGIGHLAVGLRLRGFGVVASDASRAMVDRTRKLVSDRGVDLPTAVCRWEQLAAQGWSTSFDAVFFVGNSLAHAPGQVARRAALGQMAGVPRAGGLLVVTSRNWELVRSRGSGLSIGERLVERDGVRGLVAHGWTLADGWEDLHCLDVAVALVDATGGVTSHAERLAFWPFRHGTPTRISAPPGSRPPSRHTPPRRALPRHRKTRDERGELNATKGRHGRIGHDPAGARRGTGELSGRGARSRAGRRAPSEVARRIRAFQ